jgi:hypothetical protein
MQCADGFGRRACSLLTVGGYLAHSNLQISTQSMVRLLPVSGATPFLMRMRIVVQTSPIIGLVFVLIVVRVKMFGHGVEDVTVLSHLGIGGGGNGPGAHLGPIAFAIQPEEQVEQEPGRSARGALDAEAGKPEVLANGVQECLE